MTGAAGTRIGVDVGGTFTDAVALAADGTVSTTKVLTTPDDRARGVLEGIAALGVRPDGVEAIVHGTTVVTNLLLERAGARVVLCATEHFTDVLDLRRQERAALYDLTAMHPPPLVPVECRVPVRERCEPQGPTVPLTDAECVRVTDAVRLLAPEVVVIAFLHAYVHPQHEQRLAAALRRALPGVDVVCSSDVLPELREFERTATAVAEGYARPAVARYVRGLRSRLAERGLPAPDVMTSVGGTCSAEDAAERAASLALSGPAGGVAGAAAFAQAVGARQALTIDIGGTSADVGLVLDGAPLLERGGDVAGVPIALPRVLIETVAAGGGSLVRIDEGGAVQVGPRSAGAVPGPAAFGRGGTAPTLTDAHVVLGHIAEGTWSGGVQVDRARAVAAFAPLASRLGVDVTVLARAACDTVDATMARALRRVSVERGIDPRDGVLIAFGGGGPLHGCALADRLGMTTVLVPPHAGVLSAVGLAAAPRRRTVLANALGRAQDRTRNEVAAWYQWAARALALDATAIELTVRARYVGQGHDIEVPLQPDDDGAAIAQRFTVLHERRAGFTLPQPVECVSVRATERHAGRVIRFVRPARGAHPAPVEGTDDGRTLERTVMGPASIRTPDASVRVPHGWHAHAMPEGGWRCTRTEA
ncbi:MAG: hydantoinase/oxoprolinase family protein [Gemmatimonadaceae bacterium]|nr:hydantoinase/oxoprolinase family protein [Gemmatimonadaceae bacterium]